VFSESPATFFQDTGVARWRGADWFTAITAVQPQVKGYPPFDRDVQLSIYRWAARRWVLAARMAMTPQDRFAVVKQRDVAGGH